MCNIKNPAYSRNANSLGKAFRDHLNGIPGKTFPYMANKLIIVLKLRTGLLRITSRHDLRTDLINMKVVFIPLNRTPLSPQSLCDQISIPVNICIILILIVVHPVGTLHHRNHAIFPKDLHRMPGCLRGHLLVKKPFAIFLNGTSTGTDHSRKRDLFQIIRHKRPASSCTQPCLMAILHQFCNRLYSTGRCPLFNITDRTISIKKHCFFVNLLSTSCRRSTFITSLENVIRHKIPPQALQSRRYLSHRQSHKENA